MRDAIGAPKGNTSKPDEYLTKTADYVQAHLNYVVAHTHVFTTGERRLAVPVAALTSILLWGSMTGVLPGEQVVDFSQEALANNQDALKKCLEAALESL